MATPREIGNVVVFLLSDQASAITGATVAVDCGTGAGSRMTRPPRAFRRRYTAALTDVLDGLGRRHQTLPPESSARAGARVVGPAFAVEGRTNHSIDPEASIRRILEMLGAVPAGHVAVYEPGDTTCAHFGELSATSLQAHGVAGVVINGGCRDVDWSVSGSAGLRPLPHTAGRRLPLGGARVGARDRDRGVSVATGD